MGVFEQLKNNNNSSSGGGVFSRINRANQATTENEQYMMDINDGWNAENRSATVQKALSAPLDVMQTPLMKSVQQYAEEHPKQELPGRNLPVIGPVLRGLDVIADNPVSNAIAEYTMPDAPFLGQPGTNVRETFLKEAGRQPSTGVAKYIGMGAAPFFVPGAHLGTGNQVENATRQALNQFPKIGTIGRSAIIGATSGGLTEAGSAFSQGEGNVMDAVERGAYGAGLGGVLGGASAALGRYAGTKIGDSLSNLFSRQKHPAEEQINEILALPAAGETYGSKLPRLREGTIPSGETIYATGDVFKPEPLGLPAGNYIKPQRLRVESNPTTLLNNVMQKIKPEVESIITPPQRRDLLINYIQRNLDVPMEEVWNMPTKDLQELGQMVRGNMNVADVAFNTARKHGYDLPSLLEGKAPSVSSKIASDAQKRVYGIYPEQVNIRQPEGFNTSVTGQAAAPREGGFRVNRPVKEQAPLKTSIGRPEPVQTRPIPEPIQTPMQRVEPRTEVPRPSNKVKDELEFSKTVRQSPNTAQGLVNELDQNTLTGARTSDVLNRQEAGKLIEKHGIEGLYGKLMAKHLKFSAPESTAAQMIAKHYSSLGGKDNTEKAIALVSRTAREGREMGQAIQALSQWNKLDETGALLLGERQLNRGVTDTAQWASLTPEQAAPIQEAAQRIGKAQETKNLADEVLSIVTNKKPGESLTDAEKATIKRFQEQVKEINDKTKPFLPKAKTTAKETIEKVSKVPPKERTRDQVVNFLEAKAELARKRLERQRNIGIKVNIENPVFDYAIIGAAEIAKGVRNFADYSELMVKNFGEQAKPHLKEAYLKSVNMFRKENGLPTVEELERVVNHAVKHNNLDAETANSLRVAATEIGFYADKNLKLEATQDLQKVLKGLGNSTLGQKISTVQTGMQLLNPMTIGRNIIGNAALIAQEKLNKVAAVPIDWAFSKVTGERTIKFFPKNQEVMWKNFMTHSKAGWEGVSPTGTLSSYDIHPEVFGEKNPLKYITKTLGATLQGFDGAAYNSARGDVLATYAEELGKAQGLTKEQIKQQMPRLVEQLDQRIHDLADKAGLHATFQDETYLSHAAQTLKKGLNSITDKPARALVDRGLLPKSLSTEGFGFGDILVKYARTPANLIMRGIDYSPAGFVRGLYELAPLFFKREKFNQFAATRALSRAITGTLGLTGLGYTLADVGILTGSASMDKDVRSIQEQSGQGAYKVNWSALGRWVLSGFDSDAAKYQEDDKLMDYAWLQPAAISLAMGVNANKAVNDKMNGEDISGWKVAERSLFGGLKTILENPMVQGVTSVIDAGTEIIRYQKADKAKSIVKGVPASFVPTLSNQIRTSTDNYQRETFDQNIFNEMMNLVKNKIPGLSQTLPISYDSLGNQRERIQGGEENTIGQYLTALFSPARMTSYEVAPEAKLVLDLMNQSGDQNALPRIVDRYIEVEDPIAKKNKRVNLTAEQFSKLQNKVGLEVTRRLQTNSAYLSNPNTSVDAKVKKVKDILNEVGQRARNEVRSEIGYKTKAVR